MKRVLLSMGAAGAVLAGCATPTTMAPKVDTQASAAEAQKQYEYVVRTRWAERERAGRVAFQLERANVDLCPQKSARLGADFLSPADFKPEMRTAAAQALRVGSGVTVAAVFPGGPAAAAGLQPGDELLQINGTATPRELKLLGTFSADLAAQLAKAPSETLHLQIRRGSETLAVDVTPAMACGYGIEVLDSDEINAYADGKEIYVSRALLKLASTDRELALVIAHELAHDARGHIAAQMKNARMAGVGGLALDVLAAAGGVNTQGAFTKAAMQAGRNYSSPEFEAEADYVGLYFMARAGFDTTEAEDFWRKMAAEQPKAILIKSSHPPTAERFVAIASANKEITAKRAGGEALTPNEKPKKSSP